MGGPKTIKEDTEDDSSSKLSAMTDEELVECLHNNEERTSTLLKENKIYKSILKELNETNVLQTTEEELLPYTKKCFVARRHLQHLQEGFSTIKCLQSSKELKLKLDSLKLTLKNTQEAKDRFHSDVLLEKHPISKKIILQKVAAYLEDSIKNKRAMCNRYKIQIESLVMNNNKLLSQLKDQNKRLIFIDIERCQEMKYEHMKTCDALRKHKESVVVCKTKCNTLGLKLLELKRKQGLIEAIHKIKVDPRRHDLPEVFDYACAKRENENIKRNIKTWKKKVEYAEQTKLMHINALQKKNKAS